MHTRFSLFLFLTAVLIVVGCSDAPLSGGRVAQAQSAASGHDVVTRRIWDGPEVDNQGRVSFDGRYLSFAGSGLSIRDLATGENRVLVRAGSERPGHVDESVLSPDGRQVAYTWDPDEGTISLRVINTDGSGDRLLLERDAEAELGIVAPASWSPDNQVLLAVASSNTDGTRRIARVATADGAMTVLKSVGWRWPGMLSFSPDGRFIAYDLPVEEGSTQRDIFVMAADASREQTVVEHPADDQLLGWGPQGRSLLFTSDRGGTPAAWMIDVAEGRAVGEPRQIEPELWGVVNALGTDRTGRVYYAVRPTTRAAFATTFDPGTGKVLGTPVPLASDVGVGWSPDGRSLAYIRRENLEFHLLVRSLETGGVRDLPLPINYVQGWTWRADSGSVLVGGLDSKGRDGLFQFDVQTGALLSTRRHGDYYAQFGTVALTPDGRAAYFRVHPDQIVRRDLETDEERIVFKTERVVGPASVSPDGQQLAFAVTDSDPPRRTSIYVMPADGGTPREVVQLPEGVNKYPGSGPPVWSGDRFLLAVVGNDNENWISSIALHDGRIEKLGLGISNPGGLRMHPDGQRFAFVAGESSTEVWVMEPAKASAVTTP